MARKMQQQQLILARQLRFRGIPLEIPEDDDPQSQRPGLVIRQIDGRVTQFNVCEVGYQICIRIVNNLSSDFYISGFRLKLPWKDGNLCLLADPNDLEPPRARYNFLSTQKPMFARHAVLNHTYLDKLSRGFPLEGQLLWTGGVSIPDEYASGSRVAAFVVVVDQYGDEYPEPVSLRVGRRANQQLVRSRPRRSITGKAVAEFSLEPLLEQETVRVQDLRGTETPSSVRTP